MCSRWRVSAGFWEGLRSGEGVFHVWDTDPMLGLGRVAMSGTKVLSGEPQLGAQGC